MKTIQSIIEVLKSFLAPRITKNEPQLIAVTQEIFCHNMAISDYYCDESNLFI